MKSILEKKVSQNNFPKSFFKSFVERFTENIHREIQKELLNSESYRSCSKSISLKEHFTRMLTILVSSSADCYSVEFSIRLDVAIRMLQLRAPVLHSPGSVLRTPLSMLHSQRSVFLREISVTIVTLHSPNACKCFKCCNLAA